MIPRLPPALLLILGGASIYGFKHWMDTMETKAITANPEQAEKAQRHLRLLKNTGRFTIGAMVVYAGYYGYRSKQDRPTPSSVTKEEAEFHDNQYSNRDKSYQQSAHTIEEQQRLQDEINLKKLRHQYSK